MSFPKEISQSKIKLDENTEITVCVLDDGRLNNLPKPPVILSLQPLTEQQFNQLSPHQ